MIKETKILKSYQDYLLKAKGYNIKSAESKLRAIRMYRQYINKPLSNFRSNDATIFKTWLQEEKKLKIRTVYSILRYLEHFFRWLCVQKGFRSKIQSSDIEFFSLTKSEKALVQLTSEKPAPNLDYVLKMVTSISDKNEIGKRDRALFALIYCSGLRVETTISLQLGSIDSELFVDQNPDKGIKTKFSKRNLTLIFNLHPILTKSIKDWINLLKEKGFTDRDPLFPKFMSVADSDDEVLFIEMKEVTNKFLSTPNTVSQIFKRRSAAAGLEYKHPHLFRHGFFANAEQYCGNARQYKALSQSGGHKSVSTTLRTYGELPENELKMELSKIDENISNHDDLSMANQYLLDKIEELKETIKSGKRNKNF